MIFLFMTAEISKGFSPSKDGLRYSYISQNSQVKVSVPTHLLTESFKSTSGP